MYRGIMYHDNEEWCKIWRGIDLTLQNWQKELDKFWLGLSKVSKTWILIVSFWTNYIMFQLKKCRGIMFHDTEEWWKIWRKADLWSGKWHEEFGKFLLEHLKVSKLRLWWDPFIQSRKCVSLKFTDKLRIMTMKNFVKFDEELTCYFYNDITIWRMFPRIIKCFKNLHFSRLLLTKVYNIWTKKVQKSYVWWHWRLMQNLKKNWLVLSKMTWGI